MTIVMTLPKRAAYTKGTQIPSIDSPTSEVHTYVCDPHHIIKVFATIQAKCLQPLKLDARSGELKPTQDVMCLAHVVFIAKLVANRLHCGDQRSVRACPAATRNLSLGIHEERSMCDCVCACSERPRSVRRIICTGIRYTCLYWYACMDLSTYVCMSTCMPAGIRACLHAWVSACMCSCNQQYACKRACACACGHVHRHAGRRVYTQFWIRPSAQCRHAPSFDMRLTCGKRLISAPQGTISTAFHHSCTMVLFIMVLVIIISTTLLSCVSRRLYRYLVLSSDIATVVGMILLAWFNLQAWRS